MQVKLVVFGTAILNCPVLHRTLSRGDGRRVVGSNSVGVAPSTVMKKLVGLEGSLGLEITSEKYRVRAAVGVAVANPAKRFPEIGADETSVTGGP